MESLLVLFVICNIVFVSAASGSIMEGYYKKTCPSAEQIIRITTQTYISKAPTLTAPLLRMQFHDCFVRGCDGSVLLNATSTNKEPEKTSIANLGLIGFEVIDAVKDELEKVCPGIVSCSDILALVARDATVMVNGPFWSVPTGRRDGRVSLSTEVLEEIPSPFANISALKQSFARKGLTVRDLVVLSGAHTIGSAHCTSFSNDRLYNFSGKGDIDPSLDKSYIYIPTLQRKCKPSDASTKVEMDPDSFNRFDESYYHLVSKNRGLFRSDAQLLDDPETMAYVKRQAFSHGSASFFQDFSVSMLKLGKIGVLTGNNGEIRKQCAFVN